MFVITKLVLLTSVFYLALAVLLDLLILVWARFGSDGMIGMKGWPLFAFFGFLWLVSFSLAARIWMAGYRG